MSQQRKPEFRIASGMSLSARFVWIALLALGGVAVQALLSVFWGWIGVLAAVLLGLVRASTNEPETLGKREWVNVTPEEFDAASDLLKKTGRMNDASGQFSANSCTGCALLLLLIAGLGVIATALFGVADRGADADLAFRPLIQGGSAGLLFILDGLTLILPMWLVGGASAWEPPDLRTKMDQLRHIYDSMSKVPSLKWQPSLQVAKSKGGSVPLDCRLMAKVLDSDPNFIGIQVQTSLNHVQSKTYPYTYAVIIAKPEFGLIWRAEQVIEMPPEGGFDVGWLSDENAKKEAIYPRFEDKIVELDNEEGMEIAVVRQGTGGDGYHTSEDDALRVFQSALRLAFALLRMQF